MADQHEVVRRQLLLSAQGTIAEPGWARQPVWVYNRENIAAPALRIKEWDYYLAVGQGFAAAFTIADLGFAGMASVSFIDLYHVREHTESAFSALPAGRMELGRSSDQGNAGFRNRRMRLEYLTAPGKRDIRCVCRDFADGETLRAHLQLTQPEAESMNIATPWEQEPTAFYYNQKINNMPVRGYVQIGENRYEFRPETDMAVLDWGRGVWTYDNTWYWATCSARVDGVPFGFNLGYGFSDRSRASENVLLYDGKVHKLDGIEMMIPQDKDGSLQYTKPWSVTSSDGRFEAVFEPIIDRHADLDLKAVKSIQHQVFGHVTGTAVLDDGREIKMRGLTAAMERVHNRY